MYYGVVGVVINGKHGKARYLFSNIFKLVYSRGCILAGRSRYYRDQVMVVL